MYSYSGTELSPFANAWAQCVAMRVPLSKVIHLVVGEVAKLTEAVQRVWVSASPCSDVVLSSPAPHARAYPATTMSELPSYVVGRNCGQKHCRARFSRAAAKRFGRLCFEGASGVANLLLSLPTSHPTARAVSVQGTPGVSYGPRATQSSQ